MKVVTVLTDLKAKGFEDYLRPSCEYYNLDLTVLQPNTPYTSHRFKDILLSEYVQKIDKDEVVFFCDGHDTIFLAQEKEILDKYDTFQSPLVFSAEINCWPAQELSVAYPEVAHHFKYLNCGAFIGKAGFIVELYEKNPLFSKNLNSAYNWSNQFFWHYVYLNNQKDIKLDHGCEIFYNTSILLEKIKGIDFRMESTIISELKAAEEIRLNTELVFDESRVRAAITNTRPCHLHFPGPISKRLMRGNFFDKIKPWKS